MSRSTEQSPNLGVGADSTLKNSTRRSRTLDPAPPAPQRGCEHYNRDGERSARKPPTGTIYGARPQRRRLARPRQPKRHHAVADRRAGLGMTAGGDCDILLALPQIGHGIGNTGDRQPALPQLLSVAGIE